MKKVSLIVFVLFLGLAFNSVAQTTPPTDFFAGKWEFTIMGTPNGDAKMGADLVRKDGKLTGELSNLSDPTKEKIAITKIEESADKVVIYFTAQGYDIDLNLAKVDNNNLKGTMMNSMFETKAVRVK